MKTETQRKLKLYFDGQLKEPQSGQYFQAVNPSNGEVCAELADASVDDMRAAIASARRAFDEGEWSGLTIPERGIYLKRLAKLIRDNAKELAEIECLDVGKTIKHTTFIDVPTCADTFDYFGGVNDQLNGRVNQVAAPVKSITEYEPVGVVGSIFPWNYPLIFTAWKIAPALISGNTLVVKPSPTACASVMKIAELANEVGFPKGVLNIISSTSDEVARELVESASVDMISFTGGNAIGQKVMASAAKQTKKVSLELGGKSPTIVFADCDIDTALGGVMSTIFINQGQMCTAGSRLFIEDKIYDEFIEKFVAKAKSLNIGPANNNATEFGPLVSKEHRDKVADFISRGIEEGATVLAGGNVPTGENFGDGFYLEPTILSNVTNDMNVCQEEAFGPVVCVMKFSDYDEVVKLANDTKYGLAASVWTKDLDKANKISKQLQCGTVWINTYGGLYNEASFGGFKQSGSGRELGLEGLHEYMHSKHICIDETPGGKPLVAGWF